MTAGHPGESKTLELLARNYWWPRMGQYVRHYIATCDVCGRTKNRPAITAPLQPNEVPTKPWQIITADFIVGMPKSNGFSAIFVCCDRFTKMTHFVPCNDTVTAEQTADLFQRHIFSKYGIQNSSSRTEGPNSVQNYSGCCSRHWESNPPCPQHTIHRRTVRRSA